MHTDYHQRLYGVISKINPEKIFLDANDIAMWHSSVGLENDISRETKAAMESESLQEKDKDRKTIITALFQEIRNAARSPLTDRREPGRVLKLIVDVDKGLQYERRAGKTAHINSLLIDLDKTRAAAAIASLNLTQIVQMLRSSNDEFNKIRESRSTKAAGIHLPSIKMLRQANDERIADIFFHIQMAYAMTDNESDRKIIGDLINQINRRTHEAKTTFKQSLALRRRKSKKKNAEDDTTLFEDKNQKKSTTEKKTRSSKQSEISKSSDQELLDESYLLNGGNQDSLESDIDITNPIE